MNGDWNKPYRAIAAKEEKLQQDSLVQQYREFYKKKYKQEFIPHPSNIHFRHIRDLQKQVGDKASQYLYEYFEMREDWFMKQNHSLKVLLENINKVAIQVEKKFQKKQESVGTRIISFFCEACWGDISKEVPMQFSFDGGKLIRCDECEANNRPLKKVDRNKILHLKLPDMPK